MAFAVIAIVSVLTVILMPMVLPLIINHIDIREYSEYVYGYAILNLIVWICVAVWKDDIVKVNKSED